MFPTKFLSFIVHSITSKKTKTHFNNFVCGQVKPLLCKAKAGLLKILIKKQSTPVTHLKLILSQKKKRERTKKMKKKNSRKKTNEKSPFGSFRLHYNWCSTSSSHVMPVSGYTMKESWLYRDLDFSVENDGSSKHSSKYFDFVDDEDEGGISAAWNSPNEIDKQAEMFIAQNRAKFKLDKQHSYNKYKAMLARSC